MKIIQKSYNTARILSAEMIANSEIGDIRSCLACAPVMFSLFKDHYNYFGGKEYVNRDRFVLGDVGLTPLYYSLLHMFNLGLNVEDLENFGDENSVATPTPNMKTPSVDASITSKSQGIPTAVGLAISSTALSEKFNAQRFNIIANYTYCFASLSNLEEGVSQEAMSLAGSLKLSRLIVLCHYTEKQTHDENIVKKYQAMGWNVAFIRNANNSFLIDLVLSKARLSIKPTLILIKNSLEKDFPYIDGRLIDKNEVEKIKAELGFNGSFKVDNDVRQYCARTTRRLKVEYHKWEKKTVLYRNTHTQLSEELNEYFVKPKFSFSKTFKAQIEKLTDFNEINKLIVKEICDIRKCIITASIKERFLPKEQNEELSIFGKTNYRAPNLIFGNRESAMAEVCAGISLYFEAPTFVYAPICLLGQMLSGIEHSSRTNLPVLYCFYQSGSCINQQKTNIELYGQLEWLRNLKNIEIYQPSTSSELLASYENIYDNEKPSCLVLPLMKCQCPNGNFDKAKKGAYVFMSDQTENNYTIVASGRELYIALALKKLFNADGKKIKIVSVPSWTRFNSQTTKYKDSVLDIEKENLIIITTNNNVNFYDIKLNKYHYVNINDFTSTPENITDDVIKTIYKELE